MRIFTFDGLTIASYRPPPPLFIETMGSKTWGWLFFWQVIRKTILSLNSVVYYISGADPGLGQKGRSGHPPPPPIRPCIYTRQLGSEKSGRGHAMNLVEESLIAVGHGQTLLPRCGYRFLGCSETPPPPPLRLSAIFFLDSNPQMLIFPCPLNFIVVFSLPN